MDTYDLRKEDEQWKFLKEENHEMLGAFGTKQEGLDYTRDYLREHGGLLRIWREDGTMQDERTYTPVSAESAPEGSKEAVGERPRDLTRAVREGASDALEAAGRILPMASDYTSQVVYDACYYSSYGVVFTAAMIGKFIPTANPVVRGFQDGARAAWDAAERRVHKSPVGST